MDWEDIEEWMDVNRHGSCFYRILHAGRQGDW